jgi:hypothetical protein
MRPTSANARPTALSFGRLRASAESGAVSEAVMDEPARSCPPPPQARRGEPSRQAHEVKERRQHSQLEEQAIVSHRLLRQRRRLRLRRAVRIRPRPCPRETFPSGCTDDGLGVVTAPPPRFGCDPAGGARGSWNLLHREQAPRAIHVGRADRPCGHRIRRRPLRSGASLGRDRPRCPSRLHGCVRRGDLLRFAAATVTWAVALCRLLRGRAGLFGARGGVLTGHRDRDVHARGRHRDVDSPCLDDQRDTRDADAHVNRDGRHRRRQRRLGSVLRPGGRDVRHEHQETHGRQRAEAACRSRTSRANRRRAGTADPLPAAATSSRHGHELRPRCLSRTFQRPDAKSMRFGKTYPPTCTPEAPIAKSAAGRATHRTSRSTMSAPGR